jgi:hypothetical protein
MWIEKTDLERSTNVQEIEEDMSNNLSHKRNANHIYTEIPFHPIQNGNHQESEQQQMLSWCSGKKWTLCIAGGNDSHSAATMESSMEVLQETTTETTTWSCFTILSTYGRNVRSYLIKIPAHPRAQQKYSQCQTVEQTQVSVNRWMDK